MSLRMVNGLIAVASAVFCILCIHHGFKQHWGQKTPASRHFKQMAVAYAFGVVFGLIEITLISLKLITPFHYILLDSIPLVRVGESVKAVPLFPTQPA